MPSLGHTLRALTRGVPHLFRGGVPPVRAGEEQLAWHRLDARTTEGFGLRSDAFAGGEPIPTLHSADGPGLRPPLEWTGHPTGTRTLALIVEDPDAPTPRPFVHWLVYDLPTTVRTIAEGIHAGAMQGRNSLLRPGWTGCAPPEEDTPHRYVFQLFAVDRALLIGPNVGRSRLLRSLRGHVLGCALLTGTYQR